MSNVTVAEFINAMKKAKSSLAAAKRKALVMVASEVKLRTQQNIRRQFTKTSEKAGGAGPARGRGRSGGLFGSVSVEFGSDTARILVGGPGVPYAHIHEFGGVIRPRNKKWLTIPASPKTIGTRAGDWPDLRFIPVRGNLALLMFGRSLGKKADGVKNSVNEGDIAFRLVKKVTIPENPYLRPAIEDVATDPDFMRNLALVFGRETALFATTDWEVK